MNRAFRFRRHTFSLGSLVAGAVFLGGCAAGVDSPSGDSPADAPQASTPSAEIETKTGAEPATKLANDDDLFMLGSGTGVTSPQKFAFDMAAGLVKTIIGQAITDALFPERQQINLDELVHSIDANTKAALVQMVLDTQSGSISGSRRTLEDVERQFKRSGGSPLLEARVAAVVDRLYVVLGMVGPNAPQPAYRRDGRQIYAFAAQMIANAYYLQLQMEKDPATANGLREVLKAHLKRSIDELNAPINEMRATALAQRVGSIGICEWRSSGVLPRSKRQWVSFWDYADNREISTGEDPNECWRVREEHMRKVEENLANSLNTTYAFEAKMIDGWAAAYAELDGKPAPQRGRALSLDFGGAFGMGTWQNPNGRPFNNLLTGAYSCPAGFEQSTMLGRNHVDWIAFQCTAKPDLSGEPRWDFGGYRGAWPTPVTGPEPSRLCANGFLPARDAMMFHYAEGVDDGLWVCAKPHAPGAQAILYGGAYSRGGVDGKNSWLNPATGAATCPNGFTTTSVQGSVHFDGNVKDHPLFMCWRGNEAYTP